MNLKHFRTAGEFRRWLAKHHASASELWIRFYRKGCGPGGMSYAEAVDQALCYGWIDGIRKKLDDVSYTNRFTPRRGRSIWSTINVRRVAELKKLGLMAAPGLEAFERRDPKRSGMYSFENRPQSLPPNLEQMFRAKKSAWQFWEAQPPGYRRLMTWYVMSAVKDETRRARLMRVIDASARRERIEPMAPKPKRTASKTPRSPYS